MIPAKIFPRSFRAAQLTPRLSQSVIDEAYRLAVCLVTDEQRAVSLVSQALRRTHALGVDDGQRRLHVLASVLYSARWGALGDAEGPCLSMFPELRALTCAEQMTVLLEVACSLSVDESAVVLQRDRETVIALRRSARQTLLAAMRGVRGQDGSRMP